MDSHITRDDGEGCNSSESGWTMYLASPMQGDDEYGGKGSGSDGSNVDDGYGYPYIFHGRKGGKEYQDDGDDNDSLASDASTGPAKIKVQPSSPHGEEDQGQPKHGTTGAEKQRKEDDDHEEEDDMHTRFSTSSRKKAGNKTEKSGEGKSSKRGHGKRGSSSRTSFFW